MLFLGGLVHSGDRVLTHCSDPGEGDSRGSILVVSPPFPPSAPLVSASIAEISLTTSSAFRPLESSPRSVNIARSSATFSRFTSANNIFNTSWRVHVKTKTCTRAVSCYLATVGHLGALFKLFFNTKTHDDPLERIQERGLSADWLPRGSWSLIGYQQGRELTLFCESVLLNNSFKKEAFFMIQINLKLYLAHNIHRGYIQQKIILIQLVALHLWRWNRLQPFIRTLLRLVAGSNAAKTGYQLTINYISTYYTVY